LTRHENFEDFYKETLFSYKEKLEFLQNFEQYFIQFRTDK